mmetsp:Transcript_8576/g.15520  ORF Transcript_8576/g.15520 Transcript_8576/m.15520 type:complete len:375 (-) Transcript_8576:1191-2315(-)
MSMDRRLKHRRDSKRVLDRNKAALEAEMAWPMIDNSIGNRRGLQQLHALSGDDIRNTTQNISCGSVSAGNNVSGGLNSLGRIRKRRRIDEKSQNGIQTDDDNDELDLLFSNHGTNLLPNDTEAAIWTLRGQFPRSTLPEIEFTPPIILRSQLYAILDDHLIADSQLNQLVVSNIVRQFHSNSAPHDQVLVLTQDIQTLTYEFHKNSQKESESDTKYDQFAFCLMFHYVYPAVTSTTIHLDQLKQCITSCSTRRKPKCACGDFKTLALDVEDTVIRLVRLGFLLQKDINCYWFWVPQSGRVFEWIREGRNQLLKSIQKQKFSQILLSVRLSHRLSKSKLPVLFHIREIVGNGQVRVIQTAQGPLLRLQQDADDET